MPSLDQVLAFRQQMYEESVALVRRKGADYNRQQQEHGETLFNLKVAEILGIVPTAERGILVRLSDKFMRLISLMEPGAEPANVRESLQDTVLDCHNYLDYSLMLWEERCGNRRTETTKAAKRAMGTNDARAKAPKGGKGQRVDEALPGTRSSK